jgi:hypothetical protein
VLASLWWQRLIAQRPALLQETLLQLRADAQALARDHAS